MLFSSLLNEIEYSVLSGNVDGCEVSSLCRDSRQRAERGLFVCIKGAKTDGHEYAEMAYNNGCRAFIAQRPITLPEDACVVLTKDTRIGLARASAAFYGYPADELRVVGITGTKGKTTTALTAYQILNECKIPAAYIGSNGVKYAGKNIITANTTPESCDLQKYMRDMADAGIKYLVMEVSSQAIYMNRVLGIDFETVAFTNLYVDHIGGAEHPTFEHYRDCKKKLFTDFSAKNIIYNVDDPHAEFMISQASARLISCSPLGKKSADISARNIRNERLKSSLSVCFDVSIDEREYEASVPMPGEFSVANALIAIAICQTADLDIKDIIEKLAAVSAEGRFETLSAEWALFVIDYAHNGASLEAAIKAIRAFSPSRIICLFGSVGGRTFGRRQELGDVAAALADLCILTADNPDFESPESVIKDIAESFKKDGSCPYVSIPDRREAIRFAVANAKEGDVVLLAGKGHESYQLIAGKKIPFSERTIIEEALLELAEV